MLIKPWRSWTLPDSAATPEDVFLDRRKFMTGAASIGAGALTLGVAGDALAAKLEKDPTADLYPLKRNLRFRGGRDITPENVAAKYNNFFEFGSHKQIHKAAQKLRTRPWTVTIDGMVEKPRQVDIDTLIRAMPLEERVYRHRCVEAWSMVVPWSGFPMKALVDYAKPLSGAKYVRMETFHDPKVAGGQRQSWYPWPYIEGLTIAEATNEMAFLVTGVYGKPAAKQFGAPLRLAVPWKYGFKSIKSLVKFTFTDKRPKSFWEEILGKEYGFWANVNPKVSHPRWSQAEERVLGTKDRIPTVIYNGYGEQVAHLYQDMKGEKLFM